MKVNSYLVLFFALVALFASSCSSDNQNKSDKNYLPVARGEANVILVVMDTADWNGPLGEELKKIYSEYVPGLPQAEPYFKIRNINPSKLNTVLKSAKNMIYLTILDNRSEQGNRMLGNFTEESLKMIKNDTSLFMRTQQDRYAKGQEILHLFGQNKEQMLNHLQQNKSQLRNFFVEKENQRIAKDLFKVREKGIEKNLADEYGFKFNIPQGYDLAKNQRDFVWVRFLDPEFEKNVFVYFRRYDSMDAFDDVIGFRESITSKYMRDLEKPEIYMTMQGLANEYQTVKEVNFKGKYAKELRGLWMLSDISGGGPYVSYTFVDKSQRRIYYLEGYVFAPAGDKRIPMQEMELILQTFVSGDELK